MTNEGKEQSVDDLYDENREDRIDKLDCSDCSSGVSATDADNTSSVGTFTVTRVSGLKERSLGIIVEDGGYDMMLQSNWREDNVLQWIQALDVQVMGACRSDDRLKPLLKLNACTGAAEDRLLMHLSQNFEPSEVGMLARCLCAPLVSLRVGKIDKQGNLLCPTSTRGNLNLTLLPSSGLRISFVGDDGLTDRIATLNTDEQCLSVEIEDLYTDRSGRSFALRIQDHDNLYFWCSEKCMLSGVELLRKMRDLLKCKPSLSEVTGISKSCLDAFSVHLRAYLVGSTIIDNDMSSSSPLSTSVENSIELRPIVNIVQSSVHNSPSPSPGSSSFKDNTTMNSSLNSVVSEDRSISITSTTPSVSNLSGLSYNSEDEFSEPSGTFLFPIEKPVTNSVQIPSEALPLISPYYCWCPPTATTTMSLPPPALLCNSESLGISKLNSPFNLLNKLPPLLPDGFPFPSLKQIPNFTPLMCDPIVHIPGIEFCKTGQGYVVSAGPAIAPMGHHHHRHPLMTETESSSVEKGARETLRLLISRSNNGLNPPLLNLLPPVLTIRDERQNIVAVGSRGLFIGTRDVDTALKNTINGYDPSDGGSCGGGGSDIVEPRNG